MLAISHYSSTRSERIAEGSTSDGPARRVEQFFRRRLPPSFQLAPRKWRVTQAGRGYNNKRSGSVLCLEQLICERMTEILKHDQTDDVVRSLRPPKVQIFVDCPVSHTTTNGSMGSCLSNFSAGKQAQISMYCAVCFVVMIQVCSLAPVVCAARSFQLTRIALSHFNAVS